MKQLINYCPVPGYDNDIPTTDEALKSYLDLTGLDGVELFIYQKQPYAVSYLNNTVYPIINAFSKQVLQTQLF